MADRQGRNGDNLFLFGMVGLGVLIVAIILLVTLF